MIHTVAIFAKQKEMAVQRGSAEGETKGAGQSTAPRAAGDARELEALRTKLADVEEELRDKSRKLEQL
jgi:hypothetical protein